MTKIKLKFMKMVCGYIAEKTLNRETERRVQELTELIVDKIKEVE